MIEIDGAQFSGSGTIVRYAAALSALTHDGLRLTNIRAKRERPGLRAQHLKALEAINEVTQGSLDGAGIGSREIVFRPGARIRGGEYRWRIGTGGSATMLAFSLLPLAAFAEEPSIYRIEGGLFQDFAPSAYHFMYALLPTLGRMGLHVDCRILRPGYPPKGGGLIELQILPARELEPLLLAEVSLFPKIHGFALSSHLEDKKVSERMARACEKTLLSQGYRAAIESLYDSTAMQGGAALAIFAESGHAAILGADMAGQPGRRSEDIGRKVARMLMEDLGTRSSVDRYLADQLILFAALAQGRSRFKIPRVSDHVETNLWLVRTLLGSQAEVHDLWVEIEGVKYERAPAKDNLTPIR